MRRGLTSFPRHCRPMMPSSCSAFSSSVGSSASRSAASLGRSKVTLMGGGGVLDEAGLEEEEGEDEEEGPEAPGPPDGRTGKGKKRCWLTQAWMGET